MTRDDDPIHPNYDGLTFRATTDRRGVIAVPACADRTPPYSYLTTEEARELLSDLEKLGNRLHVADEHSYAATFFRDVADDLKQAISACEAAA